MIPEGWQVQNLADVALIILGQSPPSSACNENVQGYPFYQGNADFGYRHPLPQRWIEKPLKIAQKDDILISVRAPVGELNIANTDCCIGRGVGSIRPLSANRNFIYYTLLNARNSLASVSQGSTFDAINGKELRSLSLLIPPLPEQMKIAAILSSVDDAIQATQAVIDQTRRVKQGLMQQLLTRGIGHTRFKQTEIGEIPEDWDVKPLETLAKSINNGFVGTAAKHYVNDGIPYLMAKNIRENRIELGQLSYISDNFHKNNPRSFLETGDLLTVQSGHIGTSATVPLELSGANCHALIITKLHCEQINSDFVAYYFNSPSGRKRLSGIFVGTTIKHINTKDLRKFLVPLPSRAEQTEIANIFKEIDKDQDASKSFLIQLNQTKRGLMQDLLTGRVRVKFDGEATT